MTTELVTFSKIDNDYVGKSILSRLPSLQRSWCIPASTETHHIYKIQSHILKVREKLHNQNSFWGSWTRWWKPGSSVSDQARQERRAHFTMKPAHRFRPAVHTVIMSVCSCSKVLSTVIKVGMKADLQHWRTWPAWKGEPLSGWVCVGRKMCALLRYHKERKSRGLKVDQPFLF